MRLSSVLVRVKYEISPYTAFIQVRLVTWTGFWSTIPVSVITAVLFINPTKYTLDEDGLAGDQPSAFEEIVEDENSQLRQGGSNTEIEPYLV
jgi:hypothetical protein